MRAHVHNFNCLSSQRSQLTVVKSQIEKMVFLPFFFPQSINSKLIFIKWMFFKNSFNLRKKNKKKNIWFVLHAWRHNFPIYSRVKSLCLRGRAEIDSVFNMMHCISFQEQHRTVFISFRLYALLMVEMVRCVTSLIYQTVHEFCHLIMRDLHEECNELF